MGTINRGERLQIMLTAEELEAIDTWRFSRRMPSRAAALRELLKRGLAAEGFTLADGTRKSILLVSLGYGDDGKLFPRNPRLEFGEIASFV